MTITHPFHPLRGQRVEVVRVRRGPDPDLVVRLPDGSHAALALSSTDAGAPAAAEAGTGPPPLLDPDGLCQVARLLERLRQPPPPRPEGTAP